jgi:predicted Zn-dependent protease
MLNSAETASSSSTIVSVTPLPQQQCQEHAPDFLTSMLSALLAHPAFQQGVRYGQDYYFDSYEEAPLTEEEMIEEVEMNLSRRIVQVSQQAATRLGDQSPSYLEQLGWVVGTIAKGLTYAL